MKSLNSYDSNFFSLPLIQPNVENMVRRFRHRQHCARKRGKKQHLFVPYFLDGRKPKM